MSRLFVPGSNQYLDIVDSSVLNGVVNMTVLAWVYKLATSTDFRTIISHRNGGGGWSFRLSSNATGNFLQFLRGGITSHTSTLTINASEWVFVAMARRAGAVRFARYQAGAWTYDEVGSGDTTNVATGNWIGTVDGGPNDLWDGRVGHVGVYIGDTLSDDDIDDFRTGTFAGIAATYDFFMPICGFQDPEPDFSANNLDGTLVNNPLCAEEPPGLDECPPCPGVVTGAVKLPYLGVGP